jgi:septum formation protein
MKTQHRIVLASQSPRRQELMHMLNLPFEVQLPDPTAEPDQALPEPGESIGDFVVRLAKQKAASVLEQWQKRLLACPALIIGCDTVADVEGQVLGKPRDRQDAARMLRLLSGRLHSVWSGVCVFESSSGRCWTGKARSQLEMTCLSEVELENYLDSQAWQGKSGAFGYQDSHPWLSLVSGTADNVVGLPIELLRSLLVQAATASTSSDS